MQNKIEKEIETLKSILASYEKGDPLLRFFEGRISEYQPQDTWREWLSTNQVSDGTDNEKRVSEFTPKQQEQFKEFGYITD